MAVPTKAAQEAESRARAENGLEPGESLAGEAIGDAADIGGDAPARQTRQAGEGDEPQSRDVPTRGQFDQRRADIVARFRTDRGQQAEDQRDEISDFARSGMPPDFEQATGQQPAPADDEGAAEVGADDAGQQQPVLPKTVRVKVRGQEQDLPLEEVIAKAQIALAADNYLDEAKGKLNEVDTLLRQTRDRAPPAGQDGVHPAAPHAAQTTEPAAPAGVDPQHPEDDVDKLIETLQFGDPTEARELLRETIRKGAQEAVQPAVEASLRNQRLKDEGARTAKVLKDFEGAHPDLAKDDMARAAIERRIFDLQVEDLRAIGIDPEKIRTDRAVTPSDIAVAHRFYRSEGFQVRSPGDMLEKAASDFLAWKGVGTTATTDPSPDPAKTAPRVDISVDRTARRQAIPQQPSRTVAPKPDTQTQRSAQPRDRSDIVKNMMSSRNAPRGRVVG